MLSSTQKSRYARHLSLPGFDESSQIALQQSRILILGAGGLGSPASLYLAAAGIGHLTIIDPDTVELSNLQRQILYKESNLGASKSKSAQNALEALNSETRIEALNDSLHHGNASQLIAEHDLVLDGSDNYSTRFLVNDACYIEKTPLLHAAVYQYTGHLALFDATQKDSPCFRCLIPTPPEEGAVPNCLEAGVIGALPGILGSLQALEAIKIITEIGESLAGRLLSYNALEVQFQIRPIQRDSRCPLCGDNPSITNLHQMTPQSCPSELPKSITAKQLKTLQSQESDLFLIDVREPEEYAMKRIPGSQLIPLRSLQSSHHVLPRDKPLYIVCQAGYRSLHAIEILRQNDFKDLINVSDGIIGWD